MKILGSEAMEHSKEAQDQGPRNIKIRGNGAYTGKRPIDRVPSRLVSFCPIVSNREYSNR